MIPNHPEPAEVLFISKDVMTQVKLPSTQLVEKKAMLRVSKGLSWVQSGDLVCGSDSPVRDELSTWRRRKQFKTT